MDQVFKGISVRIKYGPVLICNRHNPELVEIRKTFTPEIYETFTPYPYVNSINDILHIILRGSPYVNHNRIGKFLSLVLDKIQDLLMEVEKDKGSTSRN